MLTKAVAFRYLIKAELQHSSSYQIFQLFVWNSLFLYSINLNTEILYVGFEKCERMGPYETLEFAAQITGEGIFLM